MSKIEVDQITQQSGSTLTVGGGACKTATVDATTVTLGRSGGTVSLASGATQSGFGRTGTVDWQTSSIKTSTFTAANGEGYFCNTTSGAFTMNLPAGSAGAIVSVQDYNNTFDSNNLTISPNGSEKINGGAGAVLLSTEGEGATLVYIDGTVGWRSIQDNAFADVGSNFISATGGTISEVGDFKVHTFTGPGTFTVCTTAVSASNNILDYVVVGGGGAASLSGGDAAGGGGGGGFRYFLNTTCAPTACAPGAPLNGYGSPSPSGTQITATATSFPVTVGAGGAGSANSPSGPYGTSGSNTIFSTVTSAGGGFGAVPLGPCSQAGKPGGSGGGGGGGGGTNNAGGTGNQPPVTPSQGNNGGNSAQTPPDHAAGGGGGAMAVGFAGRTTPSPANSGAGGAGAGLPSAFGTSGQNCGSFYYFSGGGGGGQSSPIPLGGGAGGVGGGTPAAHAPGAATANQGGGGGAGRNSASPLPGAAGGSGIVIIRYKFQ
jgi:hypothetical protein